MRETIVEVLSNVMEQDPGIFKDETIIRNIPNFDSLKYVMLISELEESYNIEIPLDRALEVETLGDLVACAQQK